MAQAREYQKCALVMGVLSSAEERHGEVVSMLESHFGPVEMQSPVMEFPYTDYYDSEMGKRPVRYLLLFGNLVDPSDLADIKTLTNRIELLFAASDGGRRVNLDPGTLSMANFVLATCKDRSHRIALRNGIYGETTLIYQNGDFQTLPWTYADYGSREIRDILISFRLRYREKLKNLRVRASET